MTKQKDYEQKVLRIHQNNFLEKMSLDSFLKQGWQIKSSTSISQGWSFGKTCCCGLIFLPLALLGKKSDVVEYILEREILEVKNNKNERNRL